MPATRTRPEGVTAPERVAAFTDAVVAIAMTLLILPLLEQVSAAGAEGLTATQVLTQNADSLWIFVTSFAMIGVFWRMHHGVWTHVSGVQDRLFWINNLWMLTIVWMPVAFALMTATAADEMQKVMYIGSMLANVLALTWMHLDIRRHPEVWAGDTPPGNGEFAAVLAMTLLLTVALVVAMALSGSTGYFAMFLMAFIPPLRAVIARRLRTPDSAGADGVR